MKRKEAIEKGLKFYDAGKPCKYGHLAPRYAGNGNCLSCEQKRSSSSRTKEYKKNYYQENKEYLDKKSNVYYHNNKETCKTYRQKRRSKRPDYDREYYAKNKEYCKKRMKLWQENNKEYVNQKKKEYYKNNRDEILEYKKQWRLDNPDYMKHWHEKNPGKDTYYSMKRYLKKKNRTLPGFADEIMEVYTHAALLRNSGEDVHVDHIVPIQGDIVSGLHVPWNLQIIPAEENLSKSNKFEAELEIFEEVFGELKD